jgi:hypothetical protein
LFPVSMRNQRVTTTTGIWFKCWGQPIRLHHFTKYYSEKRRPGQEDLNTPLAEANADVKM